MTPRDANTIPRSGRRNVVLGAAWATPTVAVAAAAPHFAASPCSGHTTPDISFGTPNGTAFGSTTPALYPGASNGWTYTSANPTSRTNGWENPLSANPVGFRGPGSLGSPFAGKGTMFACSNEPSAAGGTRVLTVAQTGQPIPAGCNYKINVGVITWTNAADTALLMDVRVGTTTIATYDTSTETDVAGHVDRGYKTFTVPPTASGNVSFVFRFTSTAVVNYEDIHLYNPTVS